MMSSTDVAGVLLAIVLVIVAYMKWCHLYWKRKNLPYLEPTFLVGNLPYFDWNRDSYNVHLKKVYLEIRKRGLKHCGIYFFAKPVYHPVDLDYIRDILTKDFHHFTDRRFYYNERDDPLSANLFALGGSRWRKVRTKLAPTFTSGRMKSMFQIIVDCESFLKQRMEIETQRGEPLEMKKVLERFTIDVIGSCAFGLDCNSFNDTNSPFMEYGKQIFQSSTWRTFLLVFGLSYPDLARLLGVRFAPRYITDFFMKLVDDTVEYREKHGIVRKDFLQLMLDLKTDDPNDPNPNAFTMEEVQAECFGIFLAGFEASSNATTFALYEMAKNQAIQEKLREEIRQVLAQHGGKITYESMNDMKYMDQIIDEVLRKHPPIGLLLRDCVKDYKIPDEDIVIKKGTMLILPVYGLHHDPAYYPDPDKFDPERFNEENKKSRPPYAYLPFGGGPRICIGIRFAVMQTKISLSSLLMDYKFTVNKKTREPLEFAANSIVLSVKNGIWLNIEKL